MAGAPGLRERTGECRRSRGTGLPRRQQEHRHAAAHRHLETSTGIGREFHRRHDEAVGLADEGALTPLVFAAGDRMQHLQRGFEMIRMDPTTAHVLGGAADRGVAGVEIHFVRIGNVARHNGALEEMDVLHLIDHSPDVVEVADG